MVSDIPHLYFFLSIALSNNELNISVFNIEKILMITSKPNSMEMNIRLSPLNVSPDLLSVPIMGAPSFLQSNITSLPCIRSPSCQQSGICFEPPSTNDRLKSASKPPIIPNQLSQFYNPFHPVLNKDQSVNSIPLIKTEQVNFNNTVKSSQITPAPLQCLTALQPYILVQAVPSPRGTILQSLASLPPSSSAPSLFSLPSSSTPSLFSLPSSLQLGSSSQLYPVPQFRSFPAIPIQLMTCGQASPSFLLISPDINQTHSSSQTFLEIPSNSFLNTTTKPGCGKSDSTNSNPIQVEPTRNTSPNDGSLSEVIQQMSPPLHNTSPLNHSETLTESCSGELLYKPQSLPNSSLLQSTNAFLDKNHLKINPFGLSFVTSSINNINPFGYSSETSFSKPFQNNKASFPSFFQPSPLQKFSFPDFQNNQNTSQTTNLENSTDQPPVNIIKNEFEEKVVEQDEINEAELAAKRRFSYKKAKELLKANVMIENILPEERLSCLCKLGECLNYRTFAKKKLLDYCSLTCQVRNGNIRRKNNHTALNAKKCKARKVFEQFILSGMPPDELEKKRLSLMCDYR
jgi:hypothetical protein